MNTYEQDLYIDDSALDVEWLNQPMLMFKYAKKLAKAKRDVSLMKEEIVVFRAELDRDIRMKPDQYDIGEIKLTEAVVQGCIVQDQEHKKKAKELINLQYESEMIKGAVEAVDERKTSLENLVKLHGQQYFAGPKVPRDFAVEVKRRKEKTEAAANASIKIKRRNN